MAYEEMNGTGTPPATRRGRCVPRGPRLAHRADRRHGRPRHLPGGAFRVQRACRVCGRRRAFQVRLDRRRARVRVSLTGYSRPCPRSAPRTCREGLRISRHDLRGRAEPAGRHVHAALPGARSRLPELRRVPREHGARHARSRSPGGYSGMPANTFNIMGFQKFFFSCAKDEKFSAEYVVPEVRRLLKENHKLHPEADEDLDLIDRYVVYPVAICHHARETDHAGPAVSPGPTSSTTGGRGGWTRSMRPRSCST